VADIGKEQCFAAIDLGERLGPPALSFQFSLVLLSSDPFGDVHSGRDHDDHASRRVPHRHAREVDNVLRTIAPEIQRLAPEGFTGHGLFDCVTDPGLHLRRTIPPAAFPERPAQDVGTIEAADLDGGPVDVEDRSVELKSRSEQALIVDRLKLLRNLSQLTVGFLQLLRPQHHLEPHRLILARGCAIVAGDLSYVFNPVHDVEDSTVRPGDRSVHG